MSPKGWITDWRDGEHSDRGMSLLHCIDVWIEYTDGQPIDLGVIPADSVIIGVAVDVETEFDGAPEVLLSLGYDALPAAYVEDFHLENGGQYFVLPYLPNVGHEPVTLGEGSDEALALAGQELTLGDVLTPTEHANIGTGFPHHQPATIGADAEHTLDDQAIYGVDAAAAQKGHIALAGELEGTADAPTVKVNHGSGAHHAPVTLGAGNDPALTLAGQEATLDLQSVQRVAIRTFTQQAGPGTYTATVVIPAGGSVFDVRWASSHLWDGDSREVTVGDDDDPDGYISGLDLTSGITLEVNGAGGASSYAGWWSVGTHYDSGAYGSYKTKYCAVQKTITATATVTGAATGTGRSRLTVLYAVPTPVAAVKT